MSANEIQVAGTHYRTDFQHWDLVLALELGYFEGQISKYVTRCRKKNGLQDAQKGLHFLEKYMEAVTHSTTVLKNPLRRPQVTSERLGTLRRYAAANALLPAEATIVEFICNWQHPRDLRDCRTLLVKLVAALQPAAEEAGTGYVNQDR